jgi:thioredoxin-related protein
MLKQIILLLVISLGLHAGSIKFANKMNYELSYETALSKAKNANKPIMMVIGTKTCPWCRKLENQTLKKDIINDIVSDKFIPLSITRDVDIYPKQFKAKVVPTIFFIDPKNEKSFHISLGYKNKKDFKEEIEKAIKNFKY